MKIFITGICGFVGSTLARALHAHVEDVEIFGIDNFSRPGSELNRSLLRAEGIKIFHADLRCASDIDSLPATDWVIDAAANPSVLAGVDGSTSSRQLIEHNLGGTVNLLEYCKIHRAAFTLLSTSRVYSIPPLAGLKTEVRDSAFSPVADQIFAPGLSLLGVAEEFSTSAPVSLYGATKVASEVLALEYGETFGFPVWINRCGVLAGAGQFGKADQGIFSYWIHSWRAGRPLRYIGFDGEGHQVRDCLHPRDLLPVLLAQFQTTGSTTPRIVNLAGGRANSLSLRQLSTWCRENLGPSASEGFLSAREPLKPRPFDIPWMVLDASLASSLWNWEPITGWSRILDEIAIHARSHPTWLDQVS